MTSAAILLRPRFGNYIWTPATPSIRNQSSSRMRESTEDLTRGTFWFSKEGFSSVDVDYQKYIFSFLISFSAHRNAQHVSPDTGLPRLMTPDSRSLCIRESTCRHNLAPVGPE